MEPGQNGVASTCFRLFVTSVVCGESCVVPYVASASRQSHCIPCLVPDGRGLELGGPSWESGSSSLTAALKLQP